MTRRVHRTAFASLAVLMAATLAACGSDTANPCAQPGPAHPRGHPPPNAHHRPARQPPPARPAATNPDRDFGFIRSWTTKTGTIYLPLTGRSCSPARPPTTPQPPTAASPRSPTTSTSKTTTPASAKWSSSTRAKVIGSQHLTGSPGPNPSSLKALLSFVHNGGPQAAATFPFHLTYNDNGLVTRVQEQYLPEPGTRGGRRLPVRQSPTPQHRLTCRRARCGAPRA